MSFRRNWFTGELEEVPSEGVGRQIIARTAVPEGAVDPARRSGSAWGRVWRGNALGVHPDQAGEFNEAAKAAGTGAWYDSQGQLCADSEGALQREYGRRGYYDKNAGTRDQSYKPYREYEAKAIDQYPANRSPMWGF